MRRLNLLPATERKKIKIKRLQSVLIWSYLLVFVFLGFVGVGMWLAKKQVIANLSATKAQAENEINSIDSPEVQAIRAIIKDINDSLEFYIKADENHVYFMPQIMEIMSLLPTSLDLQRLTLVSSDKTITLEGVAGTRSDLLKFIDDLKTQEFINVTEAPLSNLEKKEEGAFIVKIGLK